VTSDDGVADAAADTLTVVVADAAGAAGIAGVVDERERAAAASAALVGGVAVTEALDTAGAATLAVGTDALVALVAVEDVAALAVAPDALPVPAMSALSSSVQPSSAASCHEPASQSPCDCVCEMIRGECCVLSDDTAVQPRCVRSHPHEHVTVRALALKHKPRPEQALRHKLAVDEHTRHACARIRVTSSRTQCNTTSINVVDE
jgi:hypothetical protein